MKLSIRLATIDDLNEVVQLLADDALGNIRERFETALPGSYVEAFSEIDRDPNNELIVGTLPREGGDVVVGTLQLTYTPSISFQGGKRCTVESVRIAADQRGKGLGGEMMSWAIDRARRRGCISMQLTTNNERLDAHRFYAALGFKPTHLGMKLML